MSIQTCMLKAQKENINIVLDALSHTMKMKGNRQCWGFTNNTFMLLFLLNIFWSLTMFIHTFIMWKREAETSCLASQELTTGMSFLCKIILKGIVHPKIKTVIIYSPSCHSKPVVKYIFNETKSFCLSSESTSNQNLEYHNSSQN